MHLVGSLRMGLLVRLRDIDFHAYTDILLPAESFRAMARLAACPGIRRMVYGNLADTVEECPECPEWYACYEDEAGEEGTTDMIRIRRGSRYDGYFERMADRVCEVKTDEMREAILRLKPATEKIMGWSITVRKSAAVCAVMPDWSSSGVRTLRWVWLSGCLDC